MPKSPYKQIQNVYSVKHLNSFLNYTHTNHEHWYPTDKSFRVNKGIPLKEQYKYLCFRMLGRNEEAAVRMIYLTLVYRLFQFIRWYLTLQGDNSVKSAKRFNYNVLYKEY